MSSFWQFFDIPMATFRRVQNLTVLLTYSVCVRQELEFWGLTELDIEACCWGHYNRFKENKETLAAIDDSFTFKLDDDAFGVKPSQFMEWKKRVWIFLEDPNSSRAAKVKYTYYVWNLTLRKIAI